MRWLACMFLIACGKHAAPPAKQDAAAVAQKPADAAPAPADAPAAPARPTVVQVAVGAHSACAAMSDGSARCWDDRGEVTTPKLKGVKQLALGDAHACALLDDGSVACWGKIGFSDKTEQAAPTAVPGVNDTKRLFAIGGASCAEDSAGKLACWGDVDAAGHVTHAGAHRAPTAAIGLDHVTQITARAALRDDGDVVFRDGNAFAKAGASDIVEVATLGDFACGRHHDGMIDCYGSAQPCAAAPAPAAPKPAPKTKPKKGKPAKAPKPAPPPKPTGPRIEKLLQLSPARAFVPDAGVCVIAVNGHLGCVTPGDRCIVDQYGAIAKIEQVAGACVRTSSGGVQCWSAEGKHAAVAIQGVAKASALAAGGGRACAIVGERSVACWIGTGEARTIDL